MGRTSDVRRRMLDRLTVIGRGLLSLLRDPFVLVPLVLVVLLTGSAMSDAWVPLWRTSTTTISVPLWIAELLVGLLVLVGLALFAYAFGDDE